MRRGRAPALLWIVSGLAGTFLVCGARGPRAAYAQTPDPRPRPSLAESLTGAAKEAYESAVVLVNNKDCPNAITKFWQAYELSRDPRLIFDVAICYRDLRSYGRMQVLLERYRREAAATTTAEQSADLEAALAAIRSLVGTVQLTVNEDGAEVRLDGQPVGSTPLAQPFVLDLGKHTISVSKPRFTPVERSLEIAGGNATSVNVDLVRENHLASLKVLTEPDATIVPDKSQASEGRFDGQLPAGVHEVHVSKPGKKAYDARVELGDGETRSLQVSLEDVEHPAIWPWIVGGGAILAGIGGIGVGSYFIFRPQSGSGGPSGQLFTLHLPAGH